MSNTYLWPSPHKNGTMPARTIDTIERCYARLMHWLPTHGRAYTIAGELLAGLSRELRHDMSPHAIYLRGQITRYHRELAPYRGGTGEIESVRLYHMYSLILSDIEYWCES